MTKREMAIKIAAEMKEKGLRCYIHSDISADGRDYITFMPHGVRYGYKDTLCGYTITIYNNYNRNCCEVWDGELVHGFPRGGKCLYKSKEETISDSEVLSLLNRLGIEVKL